MSRTLLIICLLGLVMHGIIGWKVGGLLGSAFENAFKVEIVR